ncbi:two-component sensor histidine kinase [Candidatus Magnetobacterium bavaricum]|uniref:histidine kinase n=1 Tax=Candidatus Magnetobacterium bavaricum TaxID=29290 RepID=A0A0F3GXX9_9BACT|nr:two-component sensor histidine kinase [Candidatus Magnetobacterium bavaricum]
MTDKDELIHNAEEITKDDTNTPEVRDVVAGLLKKYIKTVHRLDRITKISDRQQREVLDVNEKLHQTYEELKQSQDRLVQAEKMASLGQLVAGVAHEINTPVGIAVGAASQLQYLTKTIATSIANKTAKKDDLFQYMHNAQEASQLILANLQRTSDLVRSFKMVSADQTSHEKRRFKVKDYAESLIMSLSPKLKTTSIKLEIKCPPDLEMDSFPGALAQVLTNLIINALMHAYDEGAAGNILIDIYRDDAFVVINFTDDGRGIAPENMGKIYDPFFTTNRAQGGTGLGLNITYNIVTQTLKGTIECQSTVDKGTTFIVRIPCDS